jgi:hypothetical protein
MHQVWLPAVSVRAAHQISQEVIPLAFAALCCGAIIDGHGSDDPCS